MHYRHTKRDANHRAIVTALRQANATVVDLAAVGGGCPDLLVGFRGCNYLLEVKNPNRTGKKLHGTAQLETGERQDKFRDTWRGHRAVVTTELESLEAIGALNVLHPVA